MREKFCINTYSYTLAYTAEDTVLRLADLGYRAAELMMYPGHLWEADMDAAAFSRLRNRIDGADFKITSINMPNIDINIAAASQEMREHSLGMLEAAIRTAGALGADHVVVGPGKSNPLFAPPKEELFGYLRQGLDRLTGVAEHSGTALALENMPFSFLPGVKDLLTFLDDYGNADIGVIYDVANGHFIGEDPSEEIRLLGSRMKLLHLSDTGPTVYRHDAVGMGDVDFATIPAVLKEVGYSTYPAIEVISHDPDKDILSSTEKLAAMGYA